MWVERQFEGDRIARMRLDQAPWSAEKLARKGATQLAWVAIGLFTGFSFVGYFTPIRELAQAVLTPDRDALERCSGSCSTARPPTATRAYLREQMCKYMCPYARFQSALIDKDSLIITYDSARGDPRGSRSRKPVPPPRGWATASTARCACRSAPPASTSATACRTSASAAPPASTSATT
jgi:polyferredoxin